MNERAIASGDIDWEYWKKQDAWTLKEAILLLLGKSPKTSYHPFPPQGFREIEDTAIRSWHAKVLLTIWNTPLIQYNIEKREYPQPNPYISHARNAFSQREVVTPETFQYKNLRPTDFIKWASGKEFYIPDEICPLNSVEHYDNEQHNFDDTNIHKECYDELHNYESNELERLLREEKKVDMAIKAAVLSAMRITKQFDTNKTPIRREDLQAMISEAGFPTLSDTLIGKIWESLPEKFRNRGGRPKGKTSK